MPETLAFALFQLGAPIGLVNAVGYGFGATLINVGLTVGASLLSSLFQQRPDAPKPSDGKTNIAEPTYPRQRHYGQVRVGGVIVFIEGREGDLYKLLAISTDRIDGIVAYYINDEIVTLDGAGRVNEYKTKGADDPDRARIFTRLGAVPEAAYTELVGAFPGVWTNDHRGDGIASALMILKQPDMEDFQKVFPQGAGTTLSLIIRGSLVLDPRTGTTSYSENAALCIRDYLAGEWGMRLGEGAVSDPSWQTEANVSDEAVALKAGGTESRWRVGMSYSMAERPADVLQRMLEACDGEIFPTPDQGLRLKVGRWEEPTVVLDDSIITAFSGLTRGGDVLTEANTIRARYTSREHDFSEQDADPWTDEEAASEAGEIAEDMELFAVPSHSQARRLMKIRHRRLNPKWRGTIVCNLGGLAMLGERFVRVTYPDYGIDDTFEIQGQPSFVIGEDGLTIIGVQADLVAMTAEAWAWNAAAEEGEAPAVPEDVEYVAPVDLQPSPPVDLRRNGDFLTWTMPNDQNVFATRLYRSNTVDFAQAVDVSDRIIATANQTANFNLSSQPIGTFYFWTVSETYRGTQSEPSDPIQTTIA